MLQWTWFWRNGRCLCLGLPACNQIIHNFLLSKNNDSYMNETRNQCYLAFWVCRGKFTGMKPLNSDVRKQTFHVFLSSFGISTFGKKCTLISLMRTNNVFLSSRWGDYLLVKVPNALTCGCYINAGYLSFTVFQQMLLKTYHGIDLLIRLIGGVLVIYLFLKFIYYYYLLKTNLYFWNYWVR